MGFIISILTGIGKFFGAIGDLLRGRLRLPDIKPKTTLKGRRKAIAIAAVLAIVGCGTFIWFNLHPLSSRFVYSRAKLTGVADLLADETAKALDNHGRILVIINLENQLPNTPPFDLWQAFDEQIKKHGGITVAGTEVVRFDASTNGPVFPAAEFDRLMKKYDKVDGIVSLVGLPLRPPADPPKHAPPIFAFQKSLGAAKKYFDADLVTVIIGPRPGANLQAEAPTPREWCSQRYQVFTAANADTLPN